MESHVQNFEMILLSAHNLDQPQFWTVVMESKYQFQAYPKSFRILKYLLVSKFMQKSYQFLSCRQFRSFLFIVSWVGLHDPLMLQTIDFIEINHVCFLQYESFLLVPFILVVLRSQMLQKVMKFIVGFVFVVPRINLRRSPCIKSHQG